MILQNVRNVQGDFSPTLPMEMEPVEEHLSADTGLLLFRQLDEELQLAREFAAQLVNTRTDPTHSTLEMVRRIGPVASDARDSRGSFHGRTRRKQFNRRRKADPLGEGQAMSWRMMLIKVA